jgi:hypothetical protein
MSKNLTTGTASGVTFNSLSELDIFFSRLTQFENFLLCERILINVTTCQKETSS